MNPSSNSGILIHDLPQPLQEDALDIFRQKSLRFHSVQRHKLGTKLFFDSNDTVLKVMRWSKIAVRGAYYSIYPLETNLTVHDMMWVLDESVIKQLLKPYGPVSDMYRVRARANSGREYTDDFRVILNVPEVQTIRSLTPLVFPNVNLEFQMSFFCRLCRQNGHKTYQCREANVGGSPRVESRPNLNRAVSSGAHSSNDARPPLGSSVAAPVSNVPRAASTRAAPLSDGGTSSAPRVSPIRLKPVNRSERTLQIVNSGGIRPQSTPSISHSASNHPGYKSRAEAGSQTPPEVKPTKKELRRLSLSDGVRRVIAFRGYLQGPLSPVRLERFLLDVRCKKKPLEVSKKYTTSTLELIRQLKRVVRECRASALCDGEDEKKDIRILERLHRRLEKDRPRKTNISRGPERIIRESSSESDEYSEAYSESDRDSIKEEYF